MSEITRIIDQLRRSQAGHAWHGSAIRELLEGVTAEQAQRKPIPAAHSIWEILLHISSWQKVAAAALRGARMPDAEHFADDWPTVPEPTEANWQAAVANADAANADLAEAASHIDDSDLDQNKVANRTYSIYFLLHGITQHNLYHAGQIALLRKAIESSAPMPPA